MFRSDVEPNTRVRGGVVILVDTKYPARRISLVMSRKAGPVKLLQPLKVTVCCIYSPDATWQLKNLQYLSMLIISLGVVSAGAMLE